MKDKILSLSKNGRGYFGEYLFECKSKNAVRAHYNSTDYILDGEDIDVKTTYHYSNIKWQAGVLHQCSSKAVPRVTRVNVIMYDDNININYDDKLIVTLSWEEVIELYPQWIVQRGKPASRRRASLNDMKQHWHKYNIGMFSTDLIKKSGMVVQDEDGHWLWKIFGDDRLDFLQKIVDITAKNKDYFKNGKGFKGSIKPMVWGNINGKYWRKNKVPVKSKLNALTRSDMKNLTCIAVKYMSKIWTKETALGNASNFLSREIKDIESLVTAVKLYYDSPKRTYSIKDVINRCV